MRNRVRFDGSNPSQGTLNITELVYSGEFKRGHHLSLDAIRVMVIYSGLAARRRLSTMTAPKPRKKSHQYRPAVGTKRYYIIQALGQGGTPAEIMKTAISLAELDGHQYTPQAMRDIRLSWITKFLRQRGVAVLYKKDTVRIFA